MVPDWDYFPRPSTDWVGNHVGTNIVPMAIRNMATFVDGLPIFGMDEYNQLRLAYEFLRFYTLDIRCWRAVSEFTWGPESHSALDYSFPFVQGQLYRDKLDIYFDAVQRSAFADVHAFPGFNYIMSLWQEGHHWGLWINTFPLFLTEGGASRRIDREWQERGGTTTTRGSVGASFVDPNWLAQMQVHLPLWDELFNERWGRRFDEILHSIELYQAPWTHLEQ
jgi:hypothetical protein